MKLTDGETFEYGQTAAEVENEDLVKQEFSFEQGKQLLGIHGKVAVNKKETKMRLVSLGFFRDECSDTRTLYQSIGEVKKFMMGSTQTVTKDDGQDGKILRILVLVLAVFALITIAYCCLKHRSKICCCCKRGKERDS